MAYASMCNELQTMTVYDANNGIMTNFRKLLIMRCQKEFEDYMEGLDKGKHVSEMEATTDEDEKKKIKGEFEALERKLRKRSLGYIRYGSHPSYIYLLNRNIIHFWDTERIDLFKYS